MSVHPYPLILALIASPWLGGCDRDSGETGLTSQTDSSTQAAAAAGQGPREEEPEADGSGGTRLEPLADLAPFFQPWTGDLDGMIERRVIRVLTVSNPVLYFVDRGRQLGITYETVRAFEDHLNRQLGHEIVKVHALILPVARDELIPRLLAGEADIAAAQLTITPERQAQVDFSEPFARDIVEIVVTGPGGAPLATLEDLSDREVHVRLSSSYAEHLRSLNNRFAAQSRPPIKIVPADERLEDGDLLEMVSAGLIPATVVDGFMAELWSKVLPDLTLHPQVAVSTGGEIAWAFRKDSPQLKAGIDGFVPTHRHRSASGNVLIDKYLRNTKWVRNARGPEDLERFRQMVDLFQKYSDRYGFDWLLMAAQGYQESGLDQSKRSPVGAIGVMQVLPSTARDPAVNIPDIEELESNIHAGIKYNRWMADNYFDEPGVDRLNRTFFALASYNAGPGRVRALRRTAAAQGLDPNRWFNHVELVAAREIGRETVQYVSNIFKYYLAYQRVVTTERRTGIASPASP